jgi:WXG100 family type VII secretion target
MTDRITITPQEVRSVADQFNNASQESEQMVSRLESTINNLSATWEGMAKQRFYGDYENWRSTMRTYVQLLAQISQELRAIAQRIEDADRLAAGR